MASPSTSVSVRTEAAPFSCDGDSPIGFVLSHGFTGSPASMRPWGQHLALAGHTVRVPRLPGHGTTWQDMNRTTWPQWYAEIESAFLELRERCEFVVVAGLSMGGTLALRIAEQYPDDTAAVVLVNPAVGSRRLDIKAVPLISRFVPSLPGIGNDIKKPGVDEYGYDRTPLKALASMTSMWAEVRRNLPRVQSPLLFFGSAEDHVVDPLSRELVLSGVSSRVLVDVTLTNSFHVATLDHDAPLIFSRTDDFIARHVGGSGRATPRSDRA